MIQRSPWRCQIGLIFLIALSLAAQDHEVRFRGFTSDDGLSQNNVFAIAQDHLGFMWLGGEDGLNRYDGYQVRIFRHDATDPSSVPSNHITSLLVDRKDRLWVGTIKGLSRFDRDTDSFVVYPLKSSDGSDMTRVGRIYEANDGSLWVGGRGGLNRFVEEQDGSGRFVSVPIDDSGQTHEVQDLMVDRSGRLWLGMLQGGLCYSDSANPGQFTWIRSKPGEPDALQNGSITSMVEHPSGVLLFGSFGGGVHLLRPGSEQFEVWSMETMPEKIKSNLIFSMAMASDGHIWFGTANSGAYRTRLNTGVIQNFEYNPSDTRSLTDNTVWTIAEDATGNMWFGTFGGGASVFTPTIAPLNHFRYGPSGLESSEIHRFEEIDDGTIWIGTSGGLSQLDPYTDRIIRTYRHDPDKPDSLSDDVVWALKQDRSGRLWVGTANSGLDLLLSQPDESTRFRHFRQDPSNPNSISGNTIVFIHEDSRGDLWIGTRGNGLNRMPGDQIGFFERFSQFLDKDLPGNTTCIHEMVGLDCRMLWIGTSDAGVFRFNPDGDNPELVNYEPNSPDARGLTNASIWDIHEDAAGVLWFGTSGGLHRYDKDTDTFSAITTANGLPNNSIRGILSDHQDKLWLSTNRGLARYDPVEKAVRVYSVDDGLQSNEFKPGSRFADASGYLYFGGVNGFNRFLPESLLADPYPPRVAITELLLNNKTMTFKEPDSPLNKPIELTKTLTLSHAQKVIGLRFAALHFANPQSNSFKYKLENFDPDWNDASSANMAAVYTNLDPGSYTFRVKAANKDGVWNEEGASLEIIVNPPPWKSWWAYVLYLLAITCLALAYLRYQRVRLLKERAINERLMQVDLLKDEFLANTSHELRTPLNGIIGLTESLVDGASGPVSGRLAANLNMIVASGKRLASLVDDLLDFSRLRNRTLELHPGPVHVRETVALVFNMTRPLIEHRPIVFHNQIDENLPPVYADENRLQQILYNLIGNAVKFTMAGHITVNATIKKNMLAIAVTDTGPGIPPEKRRAIFESFQQGDGSAQRTHGGAGLGLAITLQLVHLHGGQIRLTSEQGEGSVFTFTLPLFNQQKRKAPALDKAPPSQAPFSFETKTGPAPVAHPTQNISQEIFDQVFKVLVVDDDQVNRHVLRNHLERRGYQIEEAVDGAAALNAIQNDRPDLILLDVMMPGMNGFDVCRKVRQVHSIHELPVIILTAKNQEEDISEGFAAGANDYLVKPVTKAELLSRVHTHLKLLDITRTLELKVEARTRELETRNRELAERYDELETLDQIVHAINREVELENLLNALLVEGLNLFPRVDRGAFFFWDETNQAFVVGASIVYDKDELALLSLDYRTAYERYAGSNQKLAEGLYRVGATEPLIINGRELPKPKAMLSMTILLEDKIQGILVLDNFYDGDAFDKSQVRRLHRFREHAVTAVSKAKVLRDLISTQRELMEAAHNAGMAEIATDVLHTIGNTLNSVRTSGHLIQDALMEKKSINLLTRITNALRHEGPELKTLLASEEKRMSLVDTLEKVTGKLSARELRLRSEANCLLDHLQTVVGMLNEQRKYTLTHSESSRLFDLNQTLRDIIHTKGHLFNELGVKVSFRFTEIPHINASLPKFKRVLFSLLNNACDAIAERTDRGGSIVLETRFDEEWVILNVIDDGIGIEKEQMERIFNQGYTTKNDSAGFGLHFTANTIKEMEGKVVVQSDGRGKGAVISLHLPIPG